MRISPDRHSWKIRFGLIALAMMVGGMARADAAEDRSAAAARGRIVATRVCSGCHDVSDEARPAPVRRPGVPPALLTVAASPNLDARLLEAFLWFPHGEMDNLIMTRRETADVAAYVLSLRRP